MRRGFRSSWLAGISALLTIPGAGLAQEASPQETAVYRFTNDTGRSAHGLRLVFQGADSTLSIGLVLDARHPLSKCAIGATERWISVEEKSTRVDLRWPATPACPDMMVKVQVFSDRGPIEFAEGSWHGSDGAPISALGPSDAFQGAEVTVWCVLRPQARSFDGWISNTGTEDVAAVSAFIENDAAMDGGFELGWGNPCVSEPTPLPFHKSRGIVCALGPTPRSGQGILRMQVHVEDDNCELIPASGESSLCVRWTGNGFALGDCAESPATELPETPADP